jgi:putative ABC transport system ATP-binding protein
LFCGKFKINLITLRKKPEDFFSPYLTLADEPTGNLDSKTSQDVLSLLKVSSQKFAQTIVMITHNEEIAQMADRIIRIEDGRIVSQN